MPQLAAFTEFRICDSLAEQDEVLHIGSNFVDKQTKISLCLQNLDTQLQRTLNMDDFDTAQEIRRRRKEIDEVVAEQLVGNRFCIS